MGAGVYTSREERVVHNLRLTWIAVGLLAFICGCRPAPTSLPAATPSTSATWSAKLTQTGGLIGVDLEVQVTSGGALTAINRGTGRTASTQLRESQVAELGRLLPAALSSDYAESPSNCADCFVYALALTSGDQSRTIRLDDVLIAGTAAEPLIAYLARLRDDALAAP
jgi:hypothetical protein